MTDSNQKPVVPNYVPDVGRLVTDRYDFQQHIEGINFRHDSAQIDLLPGGTPLTIISTPCTNVLQALEALAAAAEPPVIQDATTTIKGIIRLGGDLNGLNTNALSPIVSGIQGRPIVNTPPTTGQVLTYNGTSWGPANSIGFVPTGDLSGTITSQTVVGIRNKSVPNPSGTNTVLEWTGSALTWANMATFSPGGDLSGNNTSQQVIGLTGTGGVVAAHNNKILFDIGSTPVIQQTPTTTTATKMTIQAQGIGSGSGTGGPLMLAGGPIQVGESGGGQVGPVMLAVGGDSQTNASGLILFEICQPINQQSVAAFFPTDFTNGLTSTDMPSGSGSFVIYVGNTSGSPSVPSPTGTILWSQNGQLNVMQGNGLSFVVGSIPNPSTWGTQSATSGQTITYRSYASSSTSSGTNIFSSPTLTFPTLTSVRVDCIFVAKLVGSSNTAQYNLSMGFVVDSLGNTTPVGSVTSADARSIGSWNSPNITNSTNHLNVTTGWTSSGTANWTVITQIIYSPQQ